MKLVSYLKLLRITNLVLLSAGVVLGFWLAHGSGHLHRLTMIIFAAICAAGFGNVVNDIADIKTDRISHPKRPLACGDISKNSAIVYAVILAGAGIITAFFASFPHGIGTVAPILLLLAYALYLKGTPLAGNILVSVLVGYGIVFGGMFSSGLHRLFVPAILAFLLNLPREIAKDVQDEQGDRVAGYITTASLPHPVLRSIIGVCGVVYAFLVVVPYLMRDFGIAYALTCLLTAVPLHIRWTLLLYKGDLAKSAGKISGLIKYEMLCGLLALALDEGIKIFLY
jgi:geranylgeranylglycerol-phosphate geranylgeranyltransferase